MSEIYNEILRLSGVKAHAVNLMKSLTTQANQLREAAIVSLDLSTSMQYYRPLLIKFMTIISY